MLTRMKYLHKLMLAALLLLPISTTLLSAEPAPQEIAPLAPLPMEDYGAAFVKMIVMLIGILVLVILTAWMIKRYGQGKFGKFRGKESIQVLEKKPLSPKSILYLVEIEGTRLLIVESQLEVRPLHQWLVDESLGE